MQTDKVVSLVGFAMRAGKVVFGADGIERYHGKKHLIIMSKDVSQNTKERVIRRNSQVPALLSREIGVEEITHKAKCKVIAITDKQMAQAILTNKNGTYQLVTEVN